MAKVISKTVRSKSAPSGQRKKKKGSVKKTTARRKQKAGGRSSTTSVKVKAGAHFPGQQTNPQDRTAKQKKGTPPPPRKTQRTLTTEKREEQSKLRKRAADQKRKSSDEHKKARKERKKDQPYVAGMSSARAKQAKKDVGASVTKLAQKGKGSRPRRQQGANRPEYTKLEKAPAFAPASGSPAIGGGNK